jgi:hypothetical protein
MNRPLPHFYTRVNIQSGISGTLTAPTQAGCVWMKDSSTEPEPARKPLARALIACRAGVKAQGPERNIDLRLAKEAGPGWRLPCPAMLRDSMV